MQLAPDTSVRSMTRRECLNWLARAAAVAGAVPVCGLMEPACADEKGPVKIADLSTLRNERAIEIERPNLILSRTRDGVASLSIYCTHRRNKLMVDPDGSISCPVHGSLFDLSGNPQNGPASTPLAWYLTNINDDGEVWVNTSKTIQRGTWAPLPDWARPARKK